MKNLMVLAALFLQTGIVQAADGASVPVASERTFSPKGFDDNDQIQVIIEGRLPSDCYRLDQPEIKTNPVTKEILIQPKAGYYNWLCLEVLVPWTQVVNILAQHNSEIALLDFGHF